MDQVTVELDVKFEIKFKGTPDEFAEFQEVMADILKGTESKTLCIAGYVTEGLHEGLQENLTPGNEGELTVVFKKASLETEFI